MARLKGMHPALAVIVVLFIVLRLGNVYGKHVLRTEPDPEQYPGWVQWLRARGLLSGPYSLADRLRDEAEHAHRRLKREETSAAHAEREARTSTRAQPRHTPTLRATRHRLAQTLTLAAEEARIPGVVVLDVDCGPGGEAFCIAWGMGTRTDSDLHAMMATPTLRAFRGPVAQTALSAVQWPSDWDGEPAFFALALHTRENVEVHREAFNARTRALREAYEAGSPVAGDEEGEADRDATVGTGEPENAPGRPATAPE